MRQISIRRRIGFWIGICGSVLLGLHAVALGAERLPAVAFDVPTPQQDDAQIHDMQFLGSKIGWAVGEHGAIWSTTDAGQEWKFKAAPINGALRSVCFLSDRIGWIVGGGSLPYTKVSTGTVLFTSDGGATWQQLARDEYLPELHRVKFFTLEMGIAVGQPNSVFPSGILVTDDGGRTWQNVPGDGNLGWCAADFLSPEIGAVAGPQGHRAVVGQARLVVPRSAELGLNGLYALKLQAKEKGWLVGDGGLVLCTANSGAAWEAPAAMLPEAAADIFDFRAVCFRGQRGWIAGQPGSVIWHTPDGGESWQKQLTQQPLPISTLTFTSDTDGWAAGAMGTMLRTKDGGKTWTTIRGKDRRAAFLAIHSRADQVSFPLVSTLSGEQGYRGVVALLPRRDIGPDGHTALDLDLRLQEAVNLSGGSEAVVCWRFPLSIAGLDRNSERLIEDWNRRTEGKLAQTLLSQLVCQICTWRPSILILDKPAEGDALTKLMHEALLEAVKQAADPQRTADLLELADLQPWQVQKVYERLAPGSNGPAQIDPDEFLPRAGASAHVASAPAVSRLFSKVISTPRQEAYALLQNHLTAAPSTVNLGKFFAGLDLTPGSAARRKLTPITNPDVEAQMKLAKRQKHFHGILNQFFTDPRIANQMVGQLQSILAGLPPEQAALQLAQLAEMYRRSGQWDLAESTMLELVGRYEHEPAARDAMRWLLQIWISEEATFRRMQLLGRTRRQATTDFDELHCRIRRATDPYNGTGQDKQNSLPKADSDGVRQAGGTSLMHNRTTDASFEFQGDRNLKATTLREWHTSAKEMGHKLERTSAAFYNSPEIQFPLAALARQKRQHADANQVYHKFSDAGARDPWQKSAAAEIWLQHPIELPPKAMILCRSAAERPWLDGALSDACWESADEIPLTADGDNSPDAKSHAFVMLSYDQENLYLAACFPRAPGTPGDLPGKSPRRHDADLAAFDRLTLMLDIDRDYVTAHRFTVDQRGMTAEDTCEDATWNPDWYVKVDADTQSWCIEAAIPFNVLAAEPPRRNEIWGASLVRIIPAVGVESWTHPASTVPRLEAGGLIRFD